MWRKGLSVTPCRHQASNCAQNHFSPRLAAIHQKPLPLSLCLKKLSPCESCWEAELSPMIQTQPVRFSLSQAKGAGIWPNQAHLLQLASYGSQDQGGRGGRSAALAACWALGQQGPLCNLSATPNTLQLGWPGLTAMEPEPDFRKLSPGPTILSMNCLSAQASWN